MKKLLLLAGLLWATAANAQFVSGQLLTAAALNTAFAGKAPIPTGTCLGSGFALNYTLGTNTFSCNGAIDAVTLSSHTFQSPGPIGSVSPSTASFTNLTANGTLTFANGSLSLPYLAPQAANTLVGNATGSSASPTAVAVAGCNGAAQALQWTNGSGFGCNSSVATSGSNSNITSLSGLSTPLSVSQGGTGGSSLAQYQPLAGSGTGAVTTLGTGTSGQMLISNGASAYPAFGNTVSTLTATGAITPSQTAGIVGTTTNNNANAGSVGEFPTPTNLTGVSLTTATPANVSSITLTAGDWEVSGTIVFLPAGSTAVTQIQGGLNAVSATLPAITSGQLTLLQSTAFTTGGNESIPAPTARYSLASPTTIYLVAQAQFGTSTMTANGYIHARRVR